MMVRFDAGHSLRAIGTRAILGGSSSTAVLQLLGLGAALATTALLARSLGAERYGLYAYATAILSLAGLPAQAGLPTLVLRETAAYLGQGARICAIWKWATQAVLIMAAGIAALLAMWMLSGIGHPAALDPALVLIGLATVPVTALARLRTAALRGLQRPILGQMPEIANSLLMLGALTVLVLLGGVQALGPKAAMTLNLAACTAAWIFGAWLLFKAEPRTAPTPLDSQTRHDLRQAILPLALIGSLQYLNKQSDTLMIGWWLSPAEVGLYKIATQLVIPATFVLGAILIVVTPMLAQYHKDGDRTRLARLVTFTARTTCLAGLPIFLTFWFFAGPIVTFTFGPNYTETARPLVILLAGHAINALAGPVVALLNMTGHERKVMRGVMLGLGVNIALNLLLIPRLGIEGAAIATTITFVTWNVWLWRGAKRTLGIDTSVLGRHGLLKQQ